MIAIEKLVEMARYSTDQNDIDLYHHVCQYLTKKLWERN